MPVIDYTLPNEIIEAIIENYEHQCENQEG